MLTGHHTSPPSDNIWSTVDSNGRLTNGGLAVNGSLVDGMNTFVDMAGAQNMMGVIQGAANLVNVLKKMFSVHYYLCLVELRIF